MNIALTHPHRRRVAAAFAAVFTVVAVLASAPLPAAADGIGVSPVTIEFDDALRGGSYQGALTLKNVDEGQPAHFTVTPQGEIASWLQVRIDGQATPTTEFDVAPASALSVLVTMTVPDEAANGAYEGALEVLGANADTADGAGVRLGGLVLVTATVTGTETRAGQIVDFQVSPAEVGLEQRFSAIIENSGNVEILPVLDVELERDGQRIASLSSEGGGWIVAAGRTSDVTLTWATAEAAAGDYTATYTATDTAGGVERTLGSGVVDFRLEPRGTYTRAGTLTDLRVVSETRLGSPAMFEATFSNTGQIETTAVFDGGSHDGVPIAVVRSLERTIDEGRTAPIGFSADISGPGTYELRGLVNFDGLQSNPRELSFTVNAPSIARNDPSGGGLPPVVLIAVGAALCGLAAAYVLTRHRKRATAGSST